VNSGAVAGRKRASLSFTLPWSVNRQYGRLKDVVRTAYDQAFLDMARRRRPLQSDTTYVAVTGSCGKTTTMRLIAAALPARRTTRSRYPHSCDPRDMADAILSVGRDDRYAIIEMSAHPRGFIANWLPLVRPKIGVVTLIGDDHYSTFRGREAAAREKGLLVEALPDDGIAVLNADDPHVVAMVDRTRARVRRNGGYLWLRRRRRMARPSVADGASR
jgi:UDP-N-acetylmuramyl pentapeptide synthase